VTPSDNELTSDGDLLRFEVAAAEEGAGADEGAGGEILVEVGAIDFVELSAKRGRDKRPATRPMSDLDFAADGMRIC
jgi:hypothetical protein